MAKLYDILSANRVTNSIEALAVPDVYNVVPDVEVSVLGARVGRYSVLYNFKMDFNSTKDRAIGYKLTGTYADGTEYSELVPTGQNDPKRNRLYGSEIEHLVEGDIVVGLVFVDVTGGNGFVIDRASVTIVYVGNIL